MYIIIVGGGVVSYHLCRALIEEGHEVLVIEKDAKKCERFLDELGSVCMQGDGCETAILTEAGVSRADLLIATTNEDEDNLVACQVAKHKFNVPRTIARVNNPKNEKLFEKLGIDRPISITNILLEHIEEDIPTHPLIHLLTLPRENLEIVEVKIPEGSRAVGKTVNEIPLPPGSLLSLLIRNAQKPQIPSPETLFKAGDRIIALTSIDNEQALRQALTAK